MTSRMMNLKFILSKKIVIRRGLFNFQRQFIAPGKTDQSPVNSSLMFFGRFDRA